MDKEKSNSSKECKKKLLMKFNEHQAVSCLNFETILFYYVAELKVH